MSDTITTADGRTISLSELRDIAIAERDGDLIAPSTPAYLKFRQLFDAEACLALVDEIRRLRERVAELEAGLVDADNTLDACVYADIAVNRVSPATGESKGQLFDPKLFG